MAKSPTSVVAPSPVVLAGLTAVQIRDLLAQKSVTAKAVVAFLVAKEAAHGLRAPAKKLLEELTAAPAKPEAVKPAPVKPEAVKPVVAKADDLAATVAAAVAAAVAPLLARLAALEGGVVKPVAKAAEPKVAAKGLVCIVGEKRIVEMWAAGDTLEDLANEISASEQWGSYDGNESEIEPPTPDERAHVAHGPHWNVTVTEPGGLSHAWDQTYASEKEAETAAHAWASEGEDRDFLVSPHPDDEDLDELTEFVAGWDELIEELGHTPTLAFRHN